MAGGPVNAKVVRVMSEDDGGSRNEPEWTIQVQRLPDFQTGRPSPRPDDMPEDIRRALSVWLAGNQA
jgi:hypothetical protein